MPAWTLQARVEKPNIIYFLADDMGYGDVGVFWQDQRTESKKFDTPGLDRMAAEGLKLTHHYVAASVCAPSRASFLQGRHQGNADIRNNQFDSPLPDNIDIARLLKAAGYRTIHVGKAGLAGSKRGVNLSGEGSSKLEAHPLYRGWDRFFGYLFHLDGHQHYPRNGDSKQKAFIYDDFRQVTDASTDLYTTDAWTAFAKQVIIDEVNDGDDEPFFLYLAYDTPHSQLQFPATAYPGEDYESGQHRYGLGGGVQWTTSKDSEGHVRYASTAGVGGEMDGYRHPDIDPAWSVHEQKHVGMIRRMDNSVADILQLLEDLNIDENTICIFSSDNGPHHEGGQDPNSFESYANFEGTKRDFWEAGLRVPTIVRWPGHLAATTHDDEAVGEVDYPSANWDWLPTFADLAGVPTPAIVDGVSLVPILTGDGVPCVRSYLYFEYFFRGRTQEYGQFPNHGGDPRGEMQAIRVGDYMGVRTRITGADQAFRIYDVVNDPSEGTDLAPSMPELQKQLQYYALAAHTPLSTALRPYSEAPVPAVTVAGGGPGLVYRTFESDWPWTAKVDDFEHIDRGVTPRVGSLADTSSEAKSLYFEGFIDIPSTGAWRLHLTSNSGVILRIHDRLVIDDDFTHPGSQRTASSQAIYLCAGPHPISVTCRNSSDSRVLSLEWEGSGQSREVVPDAAYFRHYE